MLCKRSFVCWCDCLTQPSRWISFNGNWQQLNSLAPFGGPLLLVFLLPPTPGPASRLSLVLDARFLFFFALLWSKSVLFLFKGEKSISSLRRMENNGYFPRVFACMCAKRAEVSTSSFTQTREGHSLCTIHSVKCSSEWSFYWVALWWCVILILFLTTDCISSFDMTVLIVFERCRSTAKKAGVDQFWLFMFKNSIEK